MCNRNEGADLLMNTATREMFWELEQLHCDTEKRGRSYHKKRLETTLLIQREEHGKISIKLSFFTENWEFKVVEFSVKSVISKAYKWEKTFELKFLKNRNFSPLCCWKKLREIFDSLENKSFLHAWRSSRRSNTFCLNCLVAFQSFFRWNFS